ncbi:hypothetical protein [Flavobacterium aquatile]|uniref:Response regulatory domain-containing protein n=1 Tax=Flavobacterium aquatile LMG 4008 = ATCC 11947 TaxID=1453498 RepID=A0A095TXA2_9FLAO|nr:hypothetical protein [Flavobacterium aquatile]KGD66998.1 hypothetical protein LG45_16425 [Flavobacterium aquatile LMG 4008 = ATCC 11947]OXA68091.1 hypothetical protein B0A61_06390 [Flavobacterium aquatile LMG 4008 = ATCC 11947]GEC80157.1 hypothetical protein FAQ01_30270 [Flavobacterium aquatile]
MNKKRLFVYDTCRGFARFIKINFSNEYEILTCNLKRNLQDSSIEEIQVAFVNINQYEDVVDFFYIRSKVKFVFALSKFPDVKLMLEEFQDVIFLDLDMLKSDAIRQILDNLKIMESN